MHILSSIEQFMKISEIININSIEENLRWYSNLAVSNIASVAIHCGLTAPRSRTFILQLSFCNESPKCIRVAIDDAGHQSINWAQEAWSCSVVFRAPSVKVVGVETVFSVLFFHYEYVCVCVRVFICLLQWIEIVNLSIHLWSIPSSHFFHLLVICQMQFILIKSVSTASAFVWGTFVAACCRGVHECVCVCGRVFLVALPSTDVSDNVMHAFAIWNHIRRVPHCAF